MFRQKRKDRPVLLNLPVPLLEDIDIAVREQGVTRTHFLRQSVERNLKHYRRVERPIQMHTQRKGMS